MATSIYIPLQDVTKNKPSKDVAVYQRTGNEGFIRTGTIKRGTSGVSSNIEKEKLRDQEAQEQQRQQQQQAQDNNKQLALQEQQRQAEAQEQQRRTDIRNAILSRKANSPFLPQSTQQNVTPDASAKVFEKRVINTRDNIPQTAYYNSYTGQQASPKEEAQLRGLEKNNQELVISSEKKNPTYAKAKGSVVGFYNTFNENLKDSITLPLAKAFGRGSKALGGPGNLEEARANIKLSSKIIDSKISPKYAGSIGEGGALISGIGIGLTEDVINKPGKYVALYGAGVGIGAGVGLASQGALAVGGITPAVTNVAITGTGIVLTGKYTKELKENINSASGSIAKGEVIGVGIGEVLTLGAGGVKGQALSNKITDVIRLGNNRVELPLEDYGLVKDFKPTLKGTLVESADYGLKNNPGGPKKVITGQVKDIDVRIPKDYSVSIAKQKQDIELFKKAGRVYQATEISFSGEEVIIQRGRSEIAGLYGATNPATYFLKAGESGVKAFGTLTNVKTPTLNLIEVSSEAFTTSKPGIPGRPFVTGMKPEIEIVISEGDILRRTGQNTFFRFNNRLVPVEEFTLIKGPKGINIKGVSLKGLGGGSRSVKLAGGSSSFKGSFSNALFTPELTGLLSLKSYSVKGVNSSSLLFGSSKGSSFFRSSSTRGGSSRSSRSSRSSSLSSLGGSSSLGSSLGSSSSFGGSSSGLLGSSGRRISTSKGLPSINIKGGNFKASSFVSVELRRFGKFRTVGLTSDVTKAVTLGRNLASNTLGATFRVRGIGSEIQTPKGFYRSPKGINTFIEKNQFRLSRTGEKKEINYFRSLNR